MQSFVAPIKGYTLNIDLPDHWSVHYAPINKAPRLSGAQIEKAFAEPIGTPTIAEIARGKASAAIIVEDLTRPCPAHVVLPYVIAQLREGGVPDDGIKVVMAVGTHRPLTCHEFREKLGDGIVDRYEVLNSFAYANQTYVGTTSEGTAVSVWSPVAAADLRITIGAVVPHVMAGFTGGGKLILPGVAGIESIVHLHKSFAGRMGPAGNPENPLRHNVEEAARLARLDVAVETVVNADLEIAGIFVGDVVQAHRQAAKLATKTCTVAAPSPVDIVIASGYPKDAELYQGFAATAPKMGGGSVKSDGTILLLMGGQEGVGYHGLRECQRPNHTRMVRRDDVKLMIYSPHASSAEMASLAPEGLRFYRRLDEALADLIATHSSPTVNIFPHGTLTLLDEEWKHA